MQIDNITFIEITSYEYQVTFMYNGSNLQTGNIPRTASEEEFLTIIRQVIAVYDAQRADNNFNSIKELYQGQSKDI